MGLTITKTAEVEVSKEQFQVSELAMQVDMYASAKQALKAALEKLEPLQALVKEMEADLRAVADAQEPDATAPTSLEGINYKLALGKKKSEVIAIDKEELIKALGEDTFKELAAVSVGDIRAYCNPKQIEKILAEDDTGPRSIKIVLQK